MPQRNYAVAPGEWLTEWLEEHQITVAGLAHQLGVAPSYAIALLVGEIEVSDPLARALADLTGTPASRWLALEAQYQKDKARLTA